MQKQNLLYYLKQLYTITTFYSLQIIALKEYIIDNNLYKNDYTSIKYFIVDFPPITFNNISARTQQNHRKAVEIYKVILQNNN